MFPRPDGRRTLPSTDLERVLALHGAIAGSIEATASEQRWTLQYLGAASLLEARLAALTSEARWRLKAHASMDRAFQLLSESDSFSIGLHEGVSGVAWAARLTNRVLASTEAFDVSDVDDMVIDYLSSPGSWDGNYDLISGATGCAVYALEHPDPRRRAAMLAAYVALLSSRAEWGRRGVCWKTPTSLLPEWQRAIYPDGCVNLGLAHGIPAVAAMLSRMAMAGFESPEASRLLEGSVAQCLAELRVDPSTNRSVVGNFRGDGMISRCAWCYGEPGLAVALGTAGKALGDRALCDKARWLFRSSVSRQDESTLRLSDIGLCHGWAGIHVMSEFLGSLVPDESPMQVQAISMIRAACDEALARGELPVFEVAVTGEAVPDPSLLNGALGVAHALLDSAVRESKAADLPWADCVLM